MNPLKRRTRGVTVAEHENRIQTLERRIPIDYPLMFSTSLGAPGALTSASPSTDFGFSFPEGDPTDPEFDDGFCTDSTYLYLPCGFSGQYEVTMQCAETGGDATNYLAPVTPGDPTPSNAIIPAFVAYVAFNGIVNTGVFTTLSIFRQTTQEPPPYRQGGYDRVWAHMRIMGANSFTAPLERRWALRPICIPTAFLAGTVNIAGLVMSVKLLPPDGVQATSSWSG